MHLMQMLRTLPDKRYFVIGVLSGATLFALVSRGPYRQYSDAEQTSTLAIRYHDTIRLTRIVLIDLINMESSARGFMLTRQPHFLEPYQNTLPKLEPDLQQLQRTVADNAGLASKVGLFSTDVVQFKRLLHQQILATQRGGSPLSVTQMLNGEKAAMDHLRLTIGSITEDGMAGLKVQLTESRHKQKQFVFLLLAGTILAIGTMFFATLIILALITRHRRLEELARESEERFRLVMNGVNDGLYDYNPVDRTVYYSPSIKTMLGYRADELPDTVDMLRDLLHPDDLAAGGDIFASASNPEHPVYSSVFRLRHKNGSWRWIMARGICMWDPAGRMTRCIGTHTDITEQKNREEDLKQLNSDLENFAYIASHDLRSPLVNLKGFASEIAYALRQTAPILAKAEAALRDEEQQVLQQAFQKEIPEALQFINHAVDKMDGITNAVLDLSRLGRRLFQMEPIDTHALLHRCLSSLAYEINQKQVEVTYEALPTVVCDPMALEQIFSNLLDNALKYMVAGRKGKITIQAQSLDDGTVFSIADNGRGIAAADQQKVFEIFRRARNSGDQRGIGIGLAFVKATLRKLGGSIWFESDVGVGTTFFFRIPARPMIHTPLTEKAA